MSDRVPAVKEPRRPPRTSKPQKNPFLCFECGKDLSKPQHTEYGEFPGWRRGPVVHCKGQAISYGSRLSGKEHHGHVKYRCRKCKGDLGCDVCAQPATEIVCTRCHDWGLFVGEEAHGKMLPNPKFSQKKIEALVKETVSKITFVDKSRPIEERQMLLQEQAKILTAKEVIPQ